MEGLPPGWRDRRHHRLARQLVAEGQAELVDAQHAAGDGGVDCLHRSVGDGGEEPRPIARVASGGELARLALALKTILAQVETRPTLIFDEIDMGVGGRTAPVVGEKLWRVAASGHQVLCVTHMPQVAAYADAHFVVARTSIDATVTSLSEDGRIEELAAMLAGTITDAARENARELLARARATTLSS